MTRATVDQKRDRRGVLALIGAGGAAAAAALFSRRKEAEAHGTAHYDSANSNPAVHGNNTGGGVGVQGNSANSAGVYGVGDAYGVYGIGDSYAGVYGVGPDYGVYGNGGSNGVFGYGGDWGVRGNGPKVGVYGEGKPGVYGTSTTGAGVRGEGTGGADSTIGVYAKNLPGKRALRTQGKVQMDCARRKALGNKSNLITLPAGTIAASNAIVMATVQGDPGNDAVIWRAFRVDANHIRITFTKKPANPVATGYWIVHPG